VILITGVTVDVVFLGIPASFLLLSYLSRIVKFSLLMKSSSEIKSFPLLRLSIPLLVDFTELR
jgi:hypothetical protein